MDSKNLPIGYDRPHHGEHKHSPLTVHGETPHSPLVPPPGLQQPHQIVMYPPAVYMMPQQKGINWTAVLIAALVAVLVLR